MQAEINETPKSYSMFENEHFLCDIEQFGHIKTPHYP